jgi:hypothetical protein
MSTDQRLMDEFPELKNKNSELFKETAKLYQDAVAFDPGAMKTPAALYLAAKSAKAALARSTPARDDESGDDGREPEVDRRHRAASQDGRAKAPKVDDGMELLGDEAKRLVKEFGITDDEFRKSRQEMGVGSRRGRR